MSYLLDKWQELAAWHFGLRGFGEAEHIRFLEGCVALDYSVRLITK